ncbi:MAG: helix-turn-helix domain-containing protein, partial [Deltaproteobacteria bacterium]|nr:helix-turn-helix domain-containing protein [Deltaproteobacteria bacterium]
MTDNSTASQRSRILAHLKQNGDLTTLQGRHQLNIMHPGMRICELRKQGYQINTIWTLDYTPEGNVHRVAKYVIFKKRQLSFVDQRGIM